MELNSPRKDPYSKFAKAHKDLIKKGYEAEFTVMDEKTLKDKNGEKYSPDDLRLDHIVRFPDRNKKDERGIYASDVTKQNELEDVEAIYALNSKNGVKGLLTESRDEAGSDVVDRFLQNVDRHDSLQENYTA